MILASGDYIMEHAYTIWAGLLISKLHLVSKYWTFGLDLPFYVTYKGYGHY